MNAGLYGNTYAFTPANVLFAIFHNLKLHFLLTAVTIVSEIFPDISHFQKMKQTTLTKLSLER